MDSAVAEKKVLRFQEKYREEVFPKLKELFSLENPHQVPKISKIIINMGVGGARENKTMMEAAVKDLSTISGQKPKVTRARLSVAGFRLREGMPVGGHTPMSTCP